MSKVLNILRQEKTNIIKTLILQTMEEFSASFVAKCYTLTVFKDMLQPCTKTQLEWTAIFVENISAMFTT